MKDCDWEKIKHFSKDEFVKPELMNFNLLKKLDCYREYLGTKIIVSYSTNGSHTKQSQHYLGNAVDVVFPEYKGSLFSLYLIAERFNFCGIGVYPKWSYKNKKIGGLHLDERPLEAPLYQGARWIGVPEFNQALGKNKNAYYALNPRNLITYNVIGFKDAS